MKHFLFVHFRETTTPDGEQVYFSLSRDGFLWEPLNDGRPVLWAYYGDHGVRDMTIVRDRGTGRFHIFATDLSLSYGMRGKYNHSWEQITRYGSRDFAHWESEDLVHWSEEEMIRLGDESFGCLWAPDVIFDPESSEYVLHWSSARPGQEFMGIYCASTKDFRHFSAPSPLYLKEDSTVIDSAMYEEDGKFYLFVKGQGKPNRLMLLEGDHVRGSFRRIEAFDRRMLELQEGVYEAPTAIRLDDGRWCLFLDYYGVPGAGQGYVPFVAPSLASGDFVRADSAFSFPYGFKHGTVLEISEEEYVRMKNHDWRNVPDGRWK